MILLQISLKLPTNIPAEHWFLLTDLLNKVEHAKYPFIWTTKLRAICLGSCWCWRLYPWKKALVDCGEFWDWLQRATIGLAVAFDDQHWQSWMTCWPSLSKSSLFDPMLRDAAEQRVRKLLSLPQGLNLQYLWFESFSFCENKFICISVLKLNKIPSLIKETYFDYWKRRKTSPRITK